MIHAALVTLVLTPWKGPSLPTASAAAAKYKLTIHGRAEESVDLRASGLPNGWVASFCTPKFCSPFRYQMRLDNRGEGVVELQVIRIDDGAEHRVHVVVAAPGAAPVRLELTDGKRR